MVKHTQTICRQQPTNCLSVCDNHVGLAFSRLIADYLKSKQKTESFINDLHIVMLDATEFCGKSIFKAFVCWLKNSLTAQKMKFFTKNFFSKRDQIRSFLRIWSHLLKKSLIENFIFCTVRVIFRHPELFKPLTTNVLHHIETSQLIYIANQLTGFIGWGT